MQDGILFSAIDAGELHLHTKCRNNDFNKSNISVSKECKNLLIKKHRLRWIKIRWQRVQLWEESK